MKTILGLKKPDITAAKMYFDAKNQFTTGPVEVSHWLKENAGEINIIDLREEADFEKGHLPHAINLPKAQWGSADGLSKDKINLLYCYSLTCHLAAKAGSFFTASGYPVMEMEGGFEEWQKNKLPTSLT